MTLEDLPWEVQNVRRAMARRGLDSLDLAVCLEITPRSARRRLGGTVRFTVGEIRCVASLLRVEAGKLAFEDPRSFRVL